MCSSPRTRPRSPIGDYIAIDRDEDMARLADVSLPAGHVRDIGAISRFTRLEG